MSDDRTTTVSWTELFDRTGEPPADLATIEAELADRRARRGSTDE